MKDWQTTFRSSFHSEWRCWWNFKQVLYNTDNITIKYRKMDLNFEKMNGLIPAIIQDNSTSKVLMLGFMNEEAYRKTVETGKVTFFSRTKNRLWTKGEEREFPECCFYKRRLWQGYPADQSKSGRSCMSHRNRYLLGRRKQRRHHVPEGITRFHWQTSRGNARRLLHHQPVRTASTKWHRK